MDATRTTRHLEKSTDNFEKQKIKDMKTIFSEFITIEMLFHGKTLEVYTAAYQNIQKIDEEDLEVFRNSLLCIPFRYRKSKFKVAYSKSPITLSAKCISGTGQCTLLCTHLGCGLVMAEAAVCSGLQHHALGAETLRSYQYGQNCRTLL
ncbi:hypothetical protein GH733_008915, partial [Mirounga leonina]